jgi:hypothetical protein
VDHPNDDNVIVHVADSMVDGHWDINNGTIHLKASVNMKGVDWPVATLLRNSGIDYKMEVSCTPFSRPQTTIASTRQPAER